MAALLIVCVTGCGSTRPQPIVLPQGRWAWSGGEGMEYHSRHYLLRTTVTDPAVIERFAATLERAFDDYRQMVPDLPLTNRPLIVYLFARHDEWASYTIETAGADAELYLRVFAGGYTVRDRFVCWLGNEPDTLSLAAHEGFHQFVGRHFLYRLPPALEEGLATTFEQTDPGQRNHRRQAALRSAADGNYLIPLETLVQLHAGDLVDRPVELREGFYGQCWALATFLRDNPQYAAAFRRLLHDTATGSLAIDVGRADASGVYHPARVKPMLVQTLGLPWSRIESDYAAHVRKLAADAPD